MGRRSMRTTMIMLVSLGGLATEARAQSLEVFGYAGVLGEWELTAAVEPTHPGDNTFAGPLTMTHVGICTQTGPEEQRGNITLELSTSRAQLDAALTLDNLPCTFSGQLAEAYSGNLICQDRPQLPLRVWLKGASALPR